MKVTLARRAYQVEREDVEAVSGEEPKTIQRYAVEIAGARRRRYPLKQAAARGLRIPPVAFTSQQAYRWLVNLGFDVLDLEGVRQ